MQNPGALADELGLVDEHAVAALRGIKIQSLRNERSDGRGPRYVKLGARVMYELSAVREYVAQHTVDPRSAAPTLIDGPPRRRARQAAA
jgi:predicted DNA-binding transcriptional regulator AlpA